MSDLATGPRGRLSKMSAVLSRRSSWLTPSKCSCKTWTRGKRFPRWAVLAAACMWRPNLTTCLNWTENTAFTFNIRTFDNADCWSALQGHPHLAFLYITPSRLTVLKKCEFETFSCLWYNWGLTWRVRLNTSSDVSRRNKQCCSYFMYFFSVFSKRIRSKGERGKIGAERLTTPCRVWLLELKMLLETITGAIHTDIWTFLL